MFILSIMLKWLVWHSLRFLRVNAPHTLHNGRGPPNWAINPITFIDFGYWA